MGAPSRLPKLRLYHYWRSSSSWRVRWAMALKGVEAELVSINLLAGESRHPHHLRRNPLGYVPVLEIVDGGEPLGGRFLAESLAIIEWLETVQPSPPLLPADPVARARARQLAEIVNAGTQPLQNPQTQRVHVEMAGGFGGEEGAAAAKTRWAKHWVTEGLRAYEAVASATAGKFSVGDEVTIADLCLIPQCYNAGRLEIPMDPFPTLRRIVENAKTTQGYRASEPERFKPPA